jgi:dynein light intermediate chain
MDVINAIIPPRDWLDSMDKLYIQYVSHQPASREDVIELRDRLDRMLLDRQARAEGVCPVREELYAQAFDEIIRQVAVDCPERGLLLMRVRDEHRMTLAAYQTIYQSSVSFGMRKQV